MGGGGGGAEGEVMLLEYNTYASFLSEQFLKGG